jgi:two-component system sensor histidine kinase KdpD
METVQMQADEESYDESTSPAPGYFLAVVGALLASALAAVVQHWFGLEDLSLVFMLAVLVVASRTSTGPAIVTALLCFLAYNFFFMEPRFTFYISARHGVATVVLFLAAALLAGRLAAKLAMQVQALSAANRFAMARQTLAQQLATATSEAEVIAAAQASLQATLNADAWIRLADGGATTGAEPSALRRIEEDGSVHNAETVEEHGWWFLPLRTADASLGVLAMKTPPRAGRLGEGQRQLVRTVADDTAQALQRIRLAADLDDERLANESERMRSALLSSVSHDLRSPLASIIGAADSLNSYGGAMDEADRHALLDTIRAEGERLDRHIQNLLDMTRLGQGELVIKRDWIGVDELIGSAVGRLRRYRPDARVNISIDSSLGPVWVHPSLVEQALFNVMENAVKFSPPGEAISVEARATRDNALQIEVGDRGPGIPEADRKRVFEMFYSADRGDRRSHGVGLGLAICRGMIAAHGGDVVALPGPDDKGTVVRLTLPLLRPVPESSP